MKKMIIPMPIALFVDMRGASKATVIIYGTQATMDPISTIRAFWLKAFPHLA